MFTHFYNSNVPHFVIEYIQDETKVNWWLFSENMNPPALKVNLSKNITKFVECNFPVCSTWVFMNMLMSVVFMWYIGHLVLPYRLRKKPTFLHEGLMMSKKLLGTLTSPHLYSNKHIWYHSSHILSSMKLKSKHMWSFCFVNTPLKRWNLIFQKNYHSGGTCMKDIIHHQVANKCVFVSNVLWIVWNHSLIYLDC